MEVWETNIFEPKTIDVESNGTQMCAKTLRQLVLQTHQWHTVMYFNIFSQGI